MSTPPAITNTLLHDYDVGSVPSPVAGNPISSLPDVVGGGAATQSTASAQPTLTQVTINGKTSWFASFDAVNDALVDTSISVSQPDTIVVIGAIKATGQQNLVNGAGAASTRQIVGSHIVTGAGDFDAYAGATTLQSTTTPTLGAYFVLAVAFTTSGTIILNGTQIASGNPGTQSLSGITIGASYNLSSFANADIARILIYSGTLSTADQKKIDSWVQDTYGITVSDYVASGPTTVTGTASIAAPALSLSGTGKRTVLGHILASIPAVTVSATGKRTVVGHFSLPLGALSITATGSTGPRTVTGSVSIDPGSLAVDATGKRTVKGTIALDLGGLSITLQRDLYVTFGTADRDQWSFGLADDDGWDLGFLDLDGWDFSQVDRDGWTYGRVDYDQTT